MTDRTLPSETLLLHHDFVRRLAAALVGAGDADDLAQDVWVQALRRPLAGDRAPEPWLRMIVRNLFRNARRQAVRRRAREQVAASEGAVPAVADIVAREESRRRVVAAVLSLPADLREVVLLRYYEALDSRAIGARLHRSPGTVRWQLSCALQRLRARLDEQHDSRAAWAAPVGWWRAKRGSLTLVRFAWSARVACLVVAALMAFLCVPRAWFADEPSPLDPTPLVATEVVREGTPQEPDRTPARDALAGGMLAGTDPSSLPRGGIEGCVLATRLREPVRATVALRSVTRGLPLSMRGIDERAVERETSTDAEGRFRFDDLPAGPYELSARGPGDHFARTTIAVGAGVHEVTLELRPPYQHRGVLAVKVIDAARRPVPDAEITIAGVEKDGSAIGYGTPPITGRTGRDGVFRLGDELRFEQFVRGAVVARSGDRAGFAWLQQPRVEVVLDHPGAIEGALVGLPERDWSGGHVRVVMHQVAHRGIDPTGIGSLRALDANGRFRVSLPAGFYEVRLDVDGVARVPREDVWRNVVEVRAGATTHAAIEVTAAAVLRGRVTDAAGLPLAEAEVSARLQTNYSATVLFRQNRYEEQRLDGDGSTFAVTRSSADGRYEFAQLGGGAYDVLVTAANVSMDARPGVVLVAGEATELAHQLAPGGTIHGIGGDVVCIREASGRECVHLVEAWEGFRVSGLAAGSYDVGMWRPTTGDDGGMERLATVTVVAGTATWVDLRRPAAILVTGALFARGVPLAGIEVRCEWARASTTAAGAFELALNECCRGCDGLGLRFYHRGLRFADHYLAGPFAATHHVGSIEVAARQVEIQVCDVDGGPASGVVFISDEAPVRLVDGKVQDQWVGVGDLWVWDGLPDGPDWLARLRVPIPADGPVPPIVLRRRPTGSVKVRVLDADGSAVVGANVKLVWIRSERAPEMAQELARAARDSNSPGTFAWTDAGGTATFPAVPAGQALVSFDGFTPQEGFWYGSRYMLPQILVVRAQELCEVVLQLPR